MGLFAGISVVQNQFAPLHDALEVIDVQYFDRYRSNFGQGWTGELTLLYISPSVWQGLIRSDAMGSVDAGVQKVIFKGKGNVKLAMSDILRTMKWGGDTDFAGVSNRFTGNGEMQQVKLNFSYRFGNSQVKAARQRKSAIEEEKKRAEGGQQGGMGNQ